MQDLIRTKTSLTLRKKNVKIFVVLVFVSLGAHDKVLVIKGPSSHCVSLSIVP